MSGVTTIGRCIGCNKVPLRLDDGVCDGCLRHPRRGRKWAQFSHRIRTDAVFALNSFNKIGHNKPEREIAGKMLFIRMYGLPEGAVCPPELLHLIESQGPEESPPRLRLVR